MISATDNLFTFRRIANHNSLEGNSITAILIDSSGNIWCGADNKGIFLLNDQWEIQEFYPSPKIVHSIFEDSTGVLWVGTNDGLAFLNKSVGSFSFLPFTRKWAVKSIIECMDRKLYFSVYGNGFIKYDLDTHEWKQYNNTIFYRDFSPSDEINMLLNDSDGLIWLASNNGLSCYDPVNNKYIKYNGYEYFSVLTCLNILKDPKGDLWIGTPYGLHHLETKNRVVKCYSKENGMSNNMICSLIYDEQNHIWCTTFQGINQIIPEIDTVITYLAGNGLVDKIYNLNVFHQDKNGKIWVGSNNGITGFIPPAKYTNVSYNAPVVISEVYSEDKKINFQSAHTNRLQIPSRGSLITIEVSTLDFHHPEIIRYQYKIKEKSDSWQSTLSGYNRITLMPEPGIYKLELRAVKDGKFSPVKEITLIVPSPWYNHYLFVLFGLFTFIFFGYWTINHIRKKKIYFIGKKQINFLSNFTNQVRASVTLIINPTEMLITYEQDPEKIKTLQYIQSNGFRILQLVEQLMQIQRGVITHEKKGIPDQTDFIKKQIKPKENSFGYKSELYKILIIEHNKNRRNYLTMLIEEKYHVITATNGKDGYHFVLTQLPDLIITTLFPSGMEENSITGKIKSNHYTNHIPIIVLSSDINPEYRIKALKEGADAFLVYPFHTEELMIVINNLLTNRLLLRGKYFEMRIQEDKNKLRNTKSMDEAFIKRVVDTIDDNFSNPEFGVEMLASLVGISRMHLHRKIKEKMGITVSDLIRNIRLKHAAILLKEKKLNISEIAFAVGFTNQAHFSTAFKRNYGVAPSEYGDYKY